jgi:RNA polymerase sigma factor (TIGR02999 family)
MTTHPHRAPESSTPSIRGEITELLVAWNLGDATARDRLAEAIYPELRRLAAFHLARRSDTPSLQATELAHEAYFKLVGQERITWKNRAQLFAILSQLLRRILTDQARHRRRQKRGGDLEPAPLTDAMVQVDGTDVDLLALDQALEELAELDPTATRVVEALFFAGLTHDEASAALDIGRATVGRSWRFARAWLHKKLYR